MADLSWDNLIKEVFLDSETAIGLISTPPGPYPQEAVVPPKEMTHIRDEINRVTQSRRMLAHGLVTPAARPGRSRLHGPCRRPRSRSTPGRRTRLRRPRASTAAGSSTTRRSPTRCWSSARKLGVKRFCVHKGLPLGPVADYNHPRDLIKAAKDFPDIDFLRLPRGAARRERGEADGRGAVDHRVLRDEEEGAGHQATSTWSWAPPSASWSRPIPTACAHLLGQVIDAFGADHVLWGTDSIWYGTPQWQIDAFRRFEIPDALIESTSTRRSRAR